LVGIHSAHYILVRRAKNQLLPSAMIGSTHHPEQTAIVTNGSIVDRSSSVKEVEDEKACLYYSGGSCVRQRKYHSR
jgi:hypothetical protein